MPSQVISQLNLGRWSSVGCTAPAARKAPCPKGPRAKATRAPCPPPTVKTACSPRGTEDVRQPSQTRRRKRASPPNVNQVLRLHLPLLGVEGCPLNIARKELLPHVSLRYKTLTIAARAFASNRNAGWNRPPVASSIQLDTAVPAPGSESPRARTPCTGAHTPPRSPLKATRRDRTTRPRSKLLHSPRMPSHPPEKGPSNRPRHPRPPTVLRTRGQSYLRRPGA